MKKQSAFTLVELMVTLAVLGILVLAAVPAFNSYVTSNRLATETNALVGAINLARNEAIKRRATVSVCASSDGATCANAGSWNSGWIVFVNTDNDAPAQVDSSEEILRVYGALSPSNAFQTSAAVANYLTFRSNGYSNAQGTFILCEGSDDTQARAISINRAGRTSLTTGGGTCTPA